MGGRRAILGKIKGENKSTKHFYFSFTQHAPVFSPYLFLTKLLHDYGKADPVKDRRIVRDKFVEKNCAGQTKHEYNLLYQQPLLGDLK